MMLLVRTYSTPTMQAYLEARATAELSSRKRDPT